MNTPNDGFSPQFNETNPSAAAPNLIAEVAHEAVSGAKRQAESVYRDVSTAAAETSGAIDDAAEALHSAGNEKLGQAVGALSDRVRTFANYLNDRRLEDLIADARALAQRNTGLCIAGSIAGGVALGFALSHLIKTSAAANSPRGRNG